MQPSLQKIHKNASILSDHILALNLLEKTFNKPQLLSKPMSKPDLKTLSQKPNIKKRISKREQNKWNMKPKKNGKKENNKSKMLSINNQESLIMSLPPFQKVGKRSNKSHMKFMKLQHKKYMKWQLHQLSKKHIKQNKTLNKEQETSNKVSKTSEKMLRENMKKENGRLKRQQEWNHKRLFMKMSNKQLFKVGKIWRKVLRMFIIRQHKKLVKLLVLMLKVKPKKQKKNSNKVLKRQSNQLKKQHYLKNL